MSGERTKRSTITVLLLLVSVHSALVFVLFPPAGLLRSDPINYNDYMLHYYHWKTFDAYMRTDGQPWGYNPYWMAGYPDNTVYDVENKGVEVLTYIASSIGLDDVRVFKWFVLLTFISGPLLTYWAARNFGFSARDSGLVLAIQIAMWHAIPFARVMVVTGAFGYAFISYLSIYTISLLYRYLRDHEGRVLFALAVICPLALLLHIYSAVIIGVPALILYFLYCRNQLWRTPVALAGLGLLTVLVNLFWLLPFFRFLHYSTVTGASLIQGSLPIFLFWSLLAVVMTPALGLMCVFSVKGFRLLSQKYGRRLSYFLLATSLFFLVVGALGRYTPVTRMLVALRYHVNAFQYLAFPGALGLIWGVRTLIDRYPRRRGSTLVMASGMVLAVLAPLLLTLGLANAPADRNPVAWFFSRRLDNAIVDNPQSVALVDWLRRNTSKEGRILIESVWSPMEEEEKSWFYMHYIPILPLLVEREFLGGPRDDTLLLHHFPSFHLQFDSFEQLVEGEVPMVLFGKPIETISLEKLQEYFDLYNVMWVICSRPVSKEYFARHPDYVSRAATIGDVWIYRVNREPSFLLGAEGKVEATYNRIQVSEFSGGDVILKYHWMEGLRTRPELRIEPFMVMDDPIGFIKIADAPPSFEVYNGY